MAEKAEKAERVEKAERAEKADQHAKYRSQKFGAWELKKCGKKGIGIGLIFLAPFHT
jgi:hypothetical protein